MFWRFIEIYADPIQKILNISKHQEQKLKIQGLPDDLKKSCFLTLFAGWSLLGSKRGQKGLRIKSERGDFAINTNAFLMILKTMLLTNDWNFYAGWSLLGSKRGQKGVRIKSELNKNGAQLAPRGGPGSSTFALGAC